MDLSLLLLPQRADECASADLRGSAGSHFGLFEPGVEHVALQRERSLQLFHHCSVAGGFVVHSSVGSLYRAGSGVGVGLKEDWDVDWE